MILQYTAISAPNFLETKNIPELVFIAGINVIAGARLDFINLNGRNFSNLNWNLHV